MKLYSLETDFATASNEQKTSTIKRDAFDLLIAFLRGRFSFDELNTALKQLSGLGVLSHQEVVTLLKQKVDKEACETSVGKGPEDMKELWQRATIIENM